jgi:mono/diheme cytochrome c family protein
MSSRLQLLIAVPIAALALTVAIPTSSRAEDTAAPAAEQRALLREGAKLWPVVCAGCHNARGPAERSPAEWDVIVQHMRTRANIPGKDARAILEYLKRR